MKKPWTLMICTLLSLAAFAFTGPAIGQVSGPADCASIPGDAERLACYDRLHGRVPVPAPAPAVAAADTPTPRAPLSLIDSAWGFEADSNRYVLGTHAPNFLLFGRYTDDANIDPYIALFEAGGKEPSLDDIEAKFQLSLKMRLWTTDDRRWGVWGAYTQQNHWQVYNDDISRPFRETNYMPELFVSHRPGVDLFGGFQWNLLNFGYTHQSNGRSDIISRSWDRLFVEFGVERGNLGVLARAWYRIEEDDDDDDNPDITDYYGYGSITTIYKWRDHSFSLMGRGHPGENKGAVQLTWMTPPILGPLRFYVQGFAGYGESMIDYDWNQRTIGIGVTLNDSL